MNTTSQPKTVTSFPTLSNQPWIRPTPQAPSQDDIASLTERAQQGDSYSQRELGNLYGCGEWVPLDLDLAEYWHIKSAETDCMNGDFDSLEGMADMFERGLRVKQSYEQAAYWYSRAIESEYTVVAHSALGNLYAKGLGVPQDYEKAAELYRQGAEDDSECYYGLGILYAKGKGVPQDDKLAAEWLCKWAETWTH